MPEIDHEVRWCLLKLADLLIRPVEETPPSVKIHIPSTPVVEAAPPLPTVKVPTTKVPAKVPRPPKPAPVLSKSASVTLSGPTKLKVPAPATPATPVAPSPKVVNASQPDVTKKAVVFATPDLPAKVAKPKNNKMAPPPPPPKAVSKPVHVPKAQSGGMPLNDLKASRNALKKLKANKHAVLFLQPVDPIRDHAPK